MSDQEILGYQRALKEARQQNQALVSQMQSQVGELREALQELGIASRNQNYAGNKSLAGLIIQIENYVRNGGGDMYREQSDDAAPSPERVSQEDINSAIMAQLAALGQAVNELRGGKDEG